MTPTIRTDRQRSYPDGGPPVGGPGADTGSPGAAGFRAFTTEIGANVVHAVECGEGDDALVLIHGLAGSSRWWARNLASLCRHRRILVPDLVGFGRSRGPTRLPRIADYAALLLDWSDAIGIGRFAIGGHSMGGQIGIHLTAAAGDRVERLILIDSSGIPRALSPRTILRFAAEVSPLWRWGDPAFLPVIASDAFTAGPRTLVRAIRSILLDDVRPLLARIRVPTLVIWGERDTLVPLGDAFEFRRAIPDARLAVLRGAGHNPMIDRPADFNRLVLRFLEGEPVGR